MSQKTSDVSEQPGTVYQGCQIEYSEPSEQSNRQQSVTPAKLMQAANGCIISDSNMCCPSWVVKQKVSLQKRLPKTCASQFGRRVTLAASAVVLHSFHLVTSVWVTGRDIHFPHSHTANQNCEDALLRKKTLEVLSCHT